MLPRRMAAEGEIWLLVKFCLSKGSANGMSRVKGRRVRMEECGWSCEYWANAMS